MLRTRQRERNASHWLGCLAIVLSVSAVSQGSPDSHPSRPDRAPFHSEGSADSNANKRTASFEGNGHARRVQGTNGHTPDSLKFQQKPGCEAIGLGELAAKRLEFFQRISTVPNNPDLVFGGAVALNESGQAFFKNQLRPNVTAVWDPELHTVRFFGSAEQEENGPKRIVRCSKQAKVFMPAGHGNAAFYSHSGSMLDLITLYGRTSARRNGDGPRSIKRMLNTEYPDLLVAVEAKDAPGHGMGDDVANYPTLGHLIRAEIKYLESLRALGIPIVPIARSGSTAVFLQTLKARRDLFDGLILVSPIHPDIRMAEDIERLYQFAREGEFIPNLWGFEWIVKRVAEMDWQNHANPFHGVPVLVLTGGMDYEVHHDVYREFERLTGNVPAGDVARYREIAGAGHNVIATKAQFPSPESLLYLYRLNAKPDSIPNENGGGVLWRQLQAQLRQVYEGLLDRSHLPENWDEIWMKISIPEPVYPALLAKLPALFEAHSTFVAPSADDILDAPRQAHREIFDFLQNEIVIPWEQRMRLEAARRDRAVARANAPRPNGYVDSPPPSPIN